MGIVIHYSGKINNIDEVVTLADEVEDFLMELGQKIYCPRHRKECLVNKIDVVHFFNGLHLLHKILIAYYKILL